MRFITESVRVVARGLLGERKDSPGFSQPPGPRIELPEHVPAIPARAKGGQSAQACGFHFGPGVGRSARRVQTTREEQMVSVLIADGVVLRSIDRNGLAEGLLGAARVQTAEHFEHPQRAVAKRLDAGIVDRDGLSKCLFSRRQVAEPHGA